MTHQATDAAPTDSGLELAVQLLDRAGGVKALSEQYNPIQEEEGGDAIDDILHQLHSVNTSQKNTSSF